jgi:hypothetical protein
LHGKISIASLRNHHNILHMKSAAFLIAVSITCVFAVPPTRIAHAQAFSSVRPNILPPPPPAPPPPAITIPKVPQLGEVPPPPQLSLPQRGSFSDRVTGCIEQGAEMGLGPNARAAFSGACANR